MNAINDLPILLASNSPRRKKLLSQIDIQFESQTATVNEDLTLDLTPLELAAYNGRLKAENVAAVNPEKLVIGADTIVVLDDKILGKPVDKKGARTMLALLSNRTHSVITGVTFIWLAKDLERSFTEETQVTFKALTSAEIDYYVNRYKPLDKAGSYGIQDWFAACVTRVEGCYYNVMGFPISRIYAALKKIAESET
ncbi:MAG: Maf family protein [Candidatus Neomarinimicrobiota bacterium]